MAAEHRRNVGVIALSLLWSLLCLSPGCVDSSSYHQRQDELTDDDGDGFTEDQGDCDDANPSVFPGADEICDGVDDNCDGQADEDPVSPVWYLDSDGDGSGDATRSVAACQQPDGFVSQATDCDDGDGAVHPGALEVCNGTDDDCNGEVDDGASDGLTWYLDQDGDGYGVDTTTLLACSSPGSGWSLQDGDCDDSWGTAFPGADELCNGLDDDCDTVADEEPTVDPPTWYLDGDGDGFGTDGSALVQCLPPTRYVDQAGDCDDALDTIHPLADELCNGLDDDCDLLVDEAPTVGDGTWYRDADGDGWGTDADTLTTCDPPPGYVAYNGDCDDGDRSTSPGATEVCNDGIDNDCDGTASGCAWDDSLELRDQLVLTGVYQDDSFGRCGAVGDLDGDGQPEVVLGAGYAYDPDNHTHPGGVYAFEAPLTADRDRDTADLAIEGGADVGQFGGTGVAVADIDGDGFDDLVAGALLESSGSLTEAGNAYVLYGPLTASGGATELADWTLQGVIDQGWYGQRVHTVGDLDGDGIQDIGIGADYNYLETYAGSGFIYLYTSARTGTEQADDSAVAFITPDAGETMGREFTGVDANGDGLGDVLIGAQGSDRGGTNLGGAYVVLGDGISGEINTDDADLFWYGESMECGAGYSVDGAGDVNDDGIDDVLIGAPSDRSAYVIWGRSDLSGGPLADADLTFRGTYSTLRQYGYMVRGVGDLNSDGEADLLIGEGGGAPNDLYVYYGPLSSSGVLHDTDADVTLYGDGTSDGSFPTGFAPGDVTGDGVPDLVVGTHTHDVGLSEWVGVAYVVPGVGM